MLFTKEEKRVLATKLSASTKLVYLLLSCRYRLFSQAGSPYQEKIEDISDYLKLNKMTVCASITTLEEIGLLVVDRKNKPFTYVIKEKNDN